MANESKPSMMRSVVIDLVINGVIPYLVYTATVSQFGEWKALLLAAVLPTLKGVRDFAQRRRVDTIGALALAGIVFGLISLSLGGTARTIMLRGVLITALTGGFYLVSLFVGRPLMFYIVRFFETGDTPEGIALSNELWKESVGFRSGMRFMTLVWGLGLFAKALVQFGMVQALAVEQILLISPIVDYGFFFGLLFWSLWYGNRMKKASA